METKHINHVVLYAKNFYRHTNDVVKDMQRFMQLDGHPFFTINTPDKVINVMRKDYLKWAESIEDAYDREHYTEWADGTVAWADGIAGEIYHMLIAYTGHVIPMDSIALDYPKYDKYHLPQFNTVNGGFAINMSFESMNAQAKHILDETHEDRMDRFMNELMDHYDWAAAVKAVKLTSNKDITEAELQDEMWDLYTDFMDQNLDTATSIVMPGYYNLYSKHFALSINTKNRHVDINCHLICNSIEYKTIGTSDNHIDNIKALFDMAIADTAGIENSCAAANRFNAEFKDGFSKCATEQSAAINCHADLFESIKTHISPSEFEQRKGTCWETGGYEYDIDYNADNHEYTLTLRLIELFSCSIADGEIRNCRATMSGELM